VRPAQGGDDGGHGVAQLVVRPSAPRVLHGRGERSILVGDGTDIAAAPRRAGQAIGWPSRPLQLTVGLAEGVAEAQDVSCATCQRRSPYGTRLLQIRLC
jgi:hypothetical protein